MKEKIYKLNKTYTFVRPVGYVSGTYLTVEDEIKANCKKNRIAVGQIIRLDSWRVIGTKVKSHKDCEKLQESIDKNKNKPKVILNQKIYERGKSTKAGKSKPGKSKSKLR